MRLACLVLAAGEGARFGGPKQLALLRGRPVLRHVLDELVPLFGADLYVVLGAYCEDVAGCIDGVCRVIRHPGWRQGLGSSIAAGVRGLPGEHGYQGVMLVLGDQVMIKRGGYYSLIERFDGSRIVASRYAGRRGVPAIFPSGMFGALARLNGEFGARELLRGDVHEIVSVPLADASRDIDTPADLSSLA